MAGRSVAAASAVLATALFVVASMPGVHAAQSGSAPGSAPLAWNEEFAYLTGMQAYIYGYPVMKYAELRAQWIASGKGPVQMAVNQYYHSRDLSDPRLQYGGSPNRETPYSVAFVDLSHEPVVLTVPPNPDGRYYTLQIADMYSDTIGYVGTRATGNVPGDYLLAGPGWQGEPPKGIQKVIRSWTPWAAIFGRTYTDGTEADLVRMRAFQDGYRITPLGTYLGGAPVPESHDVLNAAAKDDPLGAFKTMNAAMRENPPPPEHAALMRQFALVGLGPDGTSRPRQPGSRDQAGPGARHRRWRRPARPGRNGRWLDRRREPDSITAGSTARAIGVECPRTVTSWAGPGPRCSQASPSTWSERLKLRTSSLSVCPTNWPRPRRSPSATRRMSWAPSMPARRC